MDSWELPTALEVGGRQLEIRSDYRDILDIIARLEDDSEPEFVCWRVAMALFYPEWKAIPPQDIDEALQRMTGFIACGRQDDPHKKPRKLLDWQQDAGTIVADINKVAGCEVRALPYLHWWTFISYFTAIGEGQLSTLVHIRDKVQRGKKLDDWEKDYYRENRDRVELRRRYTAEEQAERDRLNAMLG